MRFACRRVLVASLLLSSAARADDHVSTTQPTEEPSESIAPPEKYCNEPHLLVCDSHANPYLDRVIEANGDYIEALESASNAATVKAFAKSHGDNKNCFDLSPTDQPECMRLFNAEARKANRSPERVAKLQSVFDRAKVAVVGVLKKRLSFEHSIKNWAAEATLQQMIKKVESVCLSAPADDEPLDFNAQYFDNSNCVEVDGLIRLVDRAPQNLLLFLEHELSHAVGPDAFPSSLGEAHPMHRELQCLGRADAARAKRADAQCFDNYAKHFKKSDPYLSQIGDAYAEDARKNPDTMRTFAETGQFFPCQQGQYDEVFADWLATEAFTDHLSDNGGTPKDSLLQASAFFCAQSDVEGSGRGSHPLHLDRIDGVLLAHPLAKFGLGCDSSQVHNTRVEDMGSDPDRKYMGANARVYCGMHLYLPIGTKK